MTPYDAFMMQINYECATGKTLTVDALSIKISSSKYETSKEWIAQNESSFHIPAMKLLYHDTVSSQPYKKSSD